uniref:Endoplasmic reticulum transmembrane protein n=1 Tax=Glossina palpalis gambiensis TaxID=67801 RepID=A0A1B0B5F7_9MUSC
MTFLWAIIDRFLCLEIIVILLIMLPIIEPIHWSRLFKSQLVKRIQQNTVRFFYLMLGVLTICLASAYVDMRKFSQVEEKNAQMKLDIVQEIHFLKAQRNLYISGFATFLIIVMKRIIAFISIINQLLAQNNAAIKQARSASKAAESMIDEKLNKNMQETTDDNKQEEEGEVSKEKPSPFVLDCLLNWNIWQLLLTENTENYNQQIISIHRFCSHSTFFVEI